MHPCMVVLSPAGDETPREEINSPLAEARTPWQPVSVPKEHVSKSIVPDMGEVWEALEVENPLLCTGRVLGLLLYLALKLGKWVSLSRSIYGTCI